MTTNEIVALLRQAMTLQPGDPLPGVRINCTVSGIHEREMHRAAQYQRGTHTLLPVRDLDEIAAAIGEPVYLQDSLGERDLLEAQAVLRGAMLDHTYVDYVVYGRRSGIPVNTATIAAAEKKVRDALSMRQQREAA